VVVQRRWDFGHGGDREKIKLCFSNEIGNIDVRVMAARQHKYNIYLHWT